MIHAVSNQRSGSLASSWWPSVVSPPGLLNSLRTETFLTVESLSWSDLHTADSGSFGELTPTAYLALAKKYSLKR